MRLAHTPRLAAAPLAAQRQLAAVRATPNQRPDSSTAQVFKQAMERYYSERSARYDSEGTFHPTMVQHIVDLAELAEGQQVLDLCCGTGQFTVRASAGVGASGHVTAVDFSQPMLDVLATKLLDLPYANVTVLHADVEQLKLPPGHFDCIVCASALVLLRHIPSTLAHWQTLLAPGGRMILDGPSDTAFIGGKLLEDAATKVGVKWPVQQVLGNESRARALLAQAGVELTSFTQQQHGRWTTMEDLEKGWTTSLPFIEPVTPPQLLDALRNEYNALAAAMLGEGDSIWSDGTMNFVVAKVLDGAGD